MSAAQFVVGERVRLRIAIPVAPAGTPGTVLRGFLSVPDTYYIQFDGYAPPKLIRAQELERPDDTPDAV